MKTKIVPDQPAPTIRKARPNLRIKPRMYVRCSIMNVKLHFVSRNWLMKISFEACEFSPIKIDYSDYWKSLINKINGSLGFFQ